MTAVVGRIVGHTIMERAWKGDWTLETTHRTCAEAETHLAFRRSARAFQGREGDLRLGGTLELTLNARCAAAADRIDALLSNLGRGWFECVGTAEELTEAGLAEPYMFEYLGRSRTRYGVDEFGDRYTIRPRGKTRFELHRIFYDSPATPHANSRQPDGAPRKLEDVDLAPVLQRFARRPS